MLNFQYHPIDIVTFIEAEKLRQETRYTAQLAKFNAAPVMQGTPDHTRHVLGTQNEMIQRPTAYLFKSHQYYEESFIGTLRLMCEKLSPNLAVEPNDLWKLEMATRSLKDGAQRQETLHIIEQDMSAIYVIHQILKKCRDLPDSDRWPEILFLKKKDKLLWERLNAALTDAQDALANGQFRAATVVSFHVLESLLGYWLRNKTPAFSWPKDKHQHEENLTITKIIKHCENEGLFKPADSVRSIDTSEVENLEQACITAASYRNLIHPDKTQRTNTDHDAGTAHSCLGTTLKLAQRIGQVL
jgi:hypothetical protein